MFEFTSPIPFIPTISIVHIKNDSTRIRHTKKVHASVNPWAYLRIFLYVCFYVYTMTMQFSIVCRNSVIHGLKVEKYSCFLWNPMGKHFLNVQMAPWRYFFVHVFLFLIVYHTNWWNGRILMGFRCYWELWGIYCRNDGFLMSIWIEFWVWDLISLPIEAVITIWYDNVW